MMSGLRLEKNNIKRKSPIRVYKVSSLLALLLLPSLLGNAQQTHIKRWEEGPLSWTDLTFRNVPDKNVCGEKHFIWDFEKARKRTSWNTVEYFLKNVVFFDKDSSWHNAARTDNNSLQTSQLLFDIQELMSRSCVEEFNQSVNDVDVDDLFLKYSAEAEEIGQKIIEETDNGRDSALVEYYAESFRNALEQTPETETVTKELPTVSVFLGYIQRGYTNSLSGVLHSASGFDYGFGAEFAWGSLSCMMTYGRGEIMENYTPFKHIWPKGEQYQLAAICVEYGYSVLDTPVIQLVPTAGIGVRPTNYLYYNEAQEEWIADGVVPLCMSFGVSCNLKLFRRINHYNISNLCRKGISEHSLQFKAFVSRGFKNDSLYGLVYNIGINYCYSVDNIFNR